jgi:tetratricopeptide (TPR) repeat protein
MLGDSGLALPDLDKAIHLRPQDAWAYDYRASLYERKGAWKHVIKDTTKAIEIEPKNATAYARRGYAIERVGWWRARASAIVDYRKAIELDPLNQLAQAHLGRLGVPRR